MEFGKTSKTLTKWRILIQNQMIIGLIVSPSSHFVHSTRHMPTKWYFRSNWSFRGIFDQPLVSTLTIISMLSFCVLFNLATYILEVLRYFHKTPLCWFFFQRLMSLYKKFIQMTKLAFVTIMEHVALFFLRPNGFSWAKF